MYTDVEQSSFMCFLWVGAIEYRKLRELSREDGWQ